MIGRYFSAIPVALLFCLLFLNTASANEKRLALVVGNSQYKFVSPLPNPVNDAKSITDILIRAGFKVLKYENLNQKQFKKAIRAFGELLPSVDIGLFFYAGHAVQVKGRNYLIPIDANIQFESDIEIESIDLSSVLSKMEGAQTSLNLVILDACRDNPFVTNSRSINQGLAFTVAPSGTLIAYSTAPGHTAYDGTGINGVYTSYLIRYMQIPEVKIEDVFKQVRRAVKKETAGQQIPWESSSLEGDFYFFRTQKEAAPLKSLETTKIVKIKKSVDIQGPLTPDKAQKITQTHVIKQPLDHDLSVNIKSMVNPQLTVCEQYFKINNLYNKSIKNALVCYQNILLEDKDNIRALQGIDKITSIYKNLFGQELENNMLSKAEYSLTILKKISPDSEFVATAQQSLDSQQAATKSKPANRFFCSDLREKETFSGTMGFSELTMEEKEYLYSHCAY